MKKNDDPFVLKYQSKDLKIAAEFLTDWLPFLTRDLCDNCTQSLSTRVHSLDPDIPSEQREKGQLKEIEIHCDCDTDNKESTNVPATSCSSPRPSGVRMSWADMAAQEEDELGDEEESNDDVGDDSKQIVQPDTERKVVQKSKPKLSRERREYLRFIIVERKKDFICLERIKGKIVNILDGLELHTGVFSAAEQKRIVDYVYILQEKGRNRELRERTFSAPKKWMRGKGRETIQFGCCYNYAVSKDGNPPGILRNQHVDPIPHLFKVIIRRLVGWHVLPPTCVPDSCIVNIYEEEDCIPPHIDHHDFVRPFCTVSFLSECNIVFGSNLQIIGDGDFSGAFSIPLPVGSVLVLNGNGADVARHCVPAVPTKRISITFRKMDETKHPVEFVPEPDLQGLQPLPYDVDNVNCTNPVKSPPHMNRQPIIREVNAENGRGHFSRNSLSEPRYSALVRSQPGSRRRMRVILDT